MTPASSTDPRPWPRWLANDPRLAGPLGVWLVLALWFVARPYTGVRHDAILYTGQALSHLWPFMNDDLFFHYGSQDKFSLFSRLLAALFPRFGVGTSEMGVLLICQSAFVAAAWTLGRHLDARTRWLAVLCAAAFSHKYASLNVFGFAENFATARSVAEPLALFALAAWMANRRWLAVALFAGSALMHPLIVLPVLVVAWVMQCREDRRWLWLALLAIPVLGLALARVAPFDALLARYDDTWWAAVAEFNRQVLVTNWDHFDWQSVAVDVTILGLALRGAGERLRSLLVSLLWCTAGLLVAALVGADLLHDVLVTGLQLWRVLWLTHLFALLCLPGVVLRHWLDGRSGRLVASAVVAALLAVGSSLPQGWVLVLWLLAAIGLQRRGSPVSTPVHRLALGAAIAAVAVVTAIDAVTTLRRVTLDPELSANTHPALILLTLPVFALAFAGLLVALIRRLPMPAGAALLAAVLALGLWNWDQRSAWSVEVESSFAKAQPFGDRLPANARMYWGDDKILAEWLLLKRPSYLSLQQAAGLLFNRGTAMEFLRRHQVFLGLETQAHLCSVVAGIMGGTEEDNATCSPTLPVLEEICQSDSRPDYMVFPLKLPKGVVDSWTFTPAAPAQPRTYYLYDCARLR